MPIPHNRNKVMSTLFHSPPNENLTYTSLHDTTPFNNTRKKRKERLHTNTESIVCAGLFLERDYPEGEEGPLQVNTPFSGVISPSLLLAFSGLFRRRIPEKDEML
ncbi:hypothetical protein TNCT_93611 [Trichonephila clavata]|uniref:Uncharacterized protein n=1 Tax=Trichonephila clavata TaxID=2740835 RepID=A0A8X6GCP8_TRICU|nr:hypothetical protein TNCT_93611 [Trichonephila clavata]